MRLSTMRAVCLLTVLASLAVLVACRTRKQPEPVPLNAPFHDQGAHDAILEALPPGWALDSTQSDELPFGHFNAGHGGELMRLVGPQPVFMLWRSGDGPWNREPIARESLALWILPGSYRPAARPPGEHHAHVPAIEVFNGGTTTAYGLVGHVIVDQERVDAVLQQASSTAWSDIASKKVSWPAWKQDLADALRDYDDTTH